MLRLLSATAEPRTCQRLYVRPESRRRRELTVHQVKTADIVVSAIGKPEFVQGSWLKPGAVVIDVGTNYIPGTISHIAIPIGV